MPRFYFGCEADDPANAWAFNRAANPLGARLNALFSSDIGHFDVPDMAEVVPEPLRMPRTVTADPGAAAAFLADTLARGHEGVLVKSLAASYEAGRRGAGWVTCGPPANGVPSCSVPGSEVAAGAATA